jgi:hypothetical protein
VVYEQCSYKWWLVVVVALPAIHVAGYVKHHKRSQYERELSPGSRIARLHQVHGSIANENAEGGSP